MSQEHPGDLLVLPLGPEGPELSCEESFEQLDRYIELARDGADADRAVPGMRAISTAAPPATTITRACWRTHPVHAARGSHGPRRDVRCRRRPQPDDHERDYEDGRPQGVHRRPAHVPDDKDHGERDEAELELKRAVAPEL